MAVNPLPDRRLLRDVIYPALYTYFDRTGRADVYIKEGNVFIKILNGYDEIKHPTPPPGHYGGGTTPSLNGLIFEIKTIEVKAQP